MLRQTSPNKSRSRRRGAQNAGPNAAKRRENASDLIPGLVAAIAFLAMGWLFGLSWLWLGLNVLLSAGVYLGARLLLSSEPAPEAPPLTTPEVLQAVRDLIPRLRDRQAQQQLTALCDRADALLRYGAAHPERGGESVFMVRQFLELTQSGVELAIESSYLPANGASESRARLHTLLDSVLNRFTTLHERLLAEDDAALATELKTLTTTLEELDKIYLTAGGDLQ